MGIEIRGVDMKLLQELACAKGSEGFCEIVCEFVASWDVCRCYGAPGDVVGDCVMLDVNELPTFGGR